MTRGTCGLTGDPIGLTGDPFNRGSPWLNQRPLTRERGPLSLTEEPFKRGPIGLTRGHCGLSGGPI